MADSIRASLNVNLGSLYFGSLAAAVLFGITSLQTFIYFKHKNPDQLGFKAVAMIVVTCISDLIVRAVFSHRIWRLSRKKVHYPVIISILSLASLGAHTQTSKPKPTLIQQYFNGVR
ncbi:hypothetical protein ONZ45_g14400 [Pleurotus djamor]|nr:hypothetical protein ONZ45_g14400 [Pleurotus djamor]